MTVGTRLEVPEWIPEILEEHFEELQFLWTQRRGAISSPDYDSVRLGRLEGRIAAHADALVLAESAGMAVVEPGLSAGEAAALAASHVLLEMRTLHAARLVLAAFREAEGDVLTGLRLGLSFGCADLVGGQLQDLVDSRSAAVGAAAAEVLTWHGTLRLPAERVLVFVSDSDPQVRQSGWRLVASSGILAPTEWYVGGLTDADPAVRSAALTAAAWTGYPGLSDYCRHLAAEPNDHAIRPLATFAATALVQEYGMVATIAANAAAGPARFRVVGAFGHPGFVDLLTTEMENPDPASAVAAGAAFTKMTGRDVGSDKRVKLSLDGKPPADDFEAEFQDEAFLPDPELARRHWQELAPGLAHAPRICRGMDVSQPLAREQFALLDMESRWEYCLRMRLFSGWQGTPLVLERYPQRF